MVANSHNRMTVVLEQIEALAKRLRADLRRTARDAGLTRAIERAAVALRKRAVLVAAHVEKYAHAARIELAKVPAKRRAPARRRVTRAA